MPQPAASSPLATRAGPAGLPGCIAAGRVARLASRPFNLLSNVGGSTVLYRRHRQVPPTVLSTSSQPVEGPSSVESSALYANQTPNMGPTTAFTARVCRLSRLASVLLLVGAAVIVGCGTTDTPDAPPAPIETPVGKSSPDAPAAQPKRPKPKLRSCGSGIRARTGTTTCPFARNVFYSYWLNRVEPGVFADASGLPAFSPALGRTIEMRCSGSSTISCRGGKRALVVFSAKAIRAFSRADAIDYAATADLGRVPAPDAAAPAPEPVDPGAEDDANGCDPNYSGACLDPNASDYECAGGSGDGPRYTGRVRVVGVDHFRLDRDDDGTGCE